LHAIDHRRDQAHVIWRATWALLLRSCRLLTAWDWGFCAPAVPHPAGEDLNRAYAEAVMDSTRGIRLG
jgi:hypothetical protein